MGLEVVTSAGRLKTSPGVVDLASQVSGVLPVANGGTHVTAIAEGAVVFAGTGGTTLTGACGSLFFDATNFRLAIGHPPVSPLTSFSVDGTPRGVMLSVNDDSSITNDICVSAQKFTATANQPSHLNLSRSRGTVATGATIVQDGDEVGLLSCTAYDGSGSYRAVARILASVHQTGPSSGAMGGKLQIQVTASGTVGGTGVITIDNDLVVSLDQGQLKFPATMNPSSNANTLDDYEEGAWTPTVSGATSATGVTYSQQTGSYRKVGDKVDCFYSITLSATGTIVGNLIIAGLPFAVRAALPATGVEGQLFANLATNWVAIGAQASAGTSTSLLRGNTAAAAANVTALTPTDITATAVFAGHFAYLT